MTIGRRSLLLASLFPLVPAARADVAFPTKPITILVPYSPGGATDIVARVIATQLHDTMGQNVIVTNKPGAFGIIAMQELARANPDGYTLLVGNVSTAALTPLLFTKQLRIDYPKTIVPITELAEVPAFLVGSAVNFAPRTAAEFIAYAKAHDGQVRYVSAGIGSFPQFDMELFARKAGIHLVHVPAKGGAADMLNALATGDVQAAFLNVASSAGMIKAGRLVPYAVTGPKRLAEWPEVPTMGEIGFPGIGTSQWQALFCPANTPPEILDLLFRQTVTALQSTRAEQVFGPANLSVVASASPAAAAIWLKNEMAHWQQVIDETQIKLE